jgi:hypothetical protein
VKWATGVLAVVAIAVCSGCGGSSSDDAAASGGGHAAPGLGVSKGSVRFVSPSGSDRARGTRDRPWRTIAKATRTLRPGQTVVILPGRYVENIVMTRSGRRGAPITLSAQHGAVLAADPARARDAVPLEFAGAAYVRVRGLTIEGATGPSTTNVYAASGAHDIEIVRCTIRHSARQGFFSERSTRRIRILASRIQDNGGSGPQHLDHDIYIEGSGHVVAGNLITGARNGYGIQIYPSSQDILVANNTIAGNGMGGIVLGSDGPTTATGATIVNNVIAHNGQDGFSTYWGATVGHDNLVRRNLAWANAQDGFAGARGVTLRDNLSGDPRFVDEAAGDYRLRPGSPAVGRAIAGFYDGADLAGHPRPKRSADLGAYELGR